VNIAARVADAAKADQVLVSEGALSRLDPGAVAVGRSRRLKAQGAPRGLRVVEVSR
jgi:adenylate cyclase